jgi:hypothetical protein
MGLVSGRGRAQPEHVEQSLLLQWADLASGRTPALALLYAIPNGGGRSRGQAGRLKAEGVKAGVPDLCLPVARGGYHSLYVEMKAGPTSRVDPSQAAWHAALRGEGHAVRVCFGWESARDVIERYLAGSTV